MSENFLNKLTITELRYECEQRELPTGGAKSDLETHLAEYFITRGIEPGLVRFPHYASPRTEANTDSDLCGRKSATRELPRIANRPTYSRTVA
jgi:hypothetical protein